MQRSATAHTGRTVKGRGNILQYIHAEVARLVHILDVLAGLIRSGNVVISQVQRGVSHDQHMGILVQGRGVASDNASLCQLFRRCQVQVGGVYTVMIKRIRQFDLVDVQVAAYDGEDESAARHVANGLDRLRRGNVQESR